MLLAIDIGNSNITFGLFKRKKLLKKLNLSTSDVGETKRLTRKLKKTFSHYSIEKILICSVVPGVERQLAGMLRRLFKRKPLVLGKDIKVPIKNLYKKPRQVGQDRLVNAYAGCRLYKAPLIIIDFGTAVTFDVVSKRGAYLGGIIVPGIELALGALAEKAALLPKIKLKKAPYIIGRSTAESMRSGIFNGYGAMCDGLVTRLRKKFGLKFNVVATGGNARLISKYSSSMKKLDDNLILKGLNLISRDLKKGQK